MPRLPRHIKLFSEALRAVEPMAITIPGTESPIVGEPGDMVSNTHRYEEHEEFGLEHEYRFNIPKHPTLRVTVDLRLDGGVYWRLLAYSRIKGKPTHGMLFSINLTHEQHDPKLLALKQRLKSATRGVDSDVRGRSMESLTEHLRAIGLDVGEDRALNLGSFERHSGKFRGTTAANLIRDFVVTAVIKGHYMGNKGYELPGFEVMDQPSQRLRLNEASLKLSEAADEDDTFEPQDADEGCDRTLTAIRRRRGQPKFRRALIDAYEGRCAVTRCDFEGALEAAHIAPYDGAHTNRVTNGLLLRADVHTLFDLHHITVDSTTMRVRIADVLRGTAYEYLDGELLRETKDLKSRPDKLALDAHRKEAKL